MRHTTTALGMAFLLASASLAFAQQTNKDVQRQLERQGYSQVHNIKAFPEGTTAQAMKDGKNWTVVIDSQGKIVRREASGGAAAALAQSNTAATGMTSGLAAGTPAIPNTAVPKQSWSGPSSAGATGVGAPGTTAKRGTEAGVAPQTASQ